MNIYPAEYEDVYQTYPITIVDAGASGGIIPLWKLHRRHLFIIGFEPDARAFDALSSQQNRLVNYFNIGLELIMLLAEPRAIGSIPKAESI
jgi:hypothetical protein